MLKKMSLLAMVIITCLTMATPASSVMPLDCDEFISGGNQGAALGCIDMVIFMYESAGPWDGTWEPGGHGTWPPL